MNSKNKVDRGILNHSFKVNILLLVAFLFLSANYVGKKYSAMRYSLKKIIELQKSIEYSPTKIIEEYSGFDRNKSDELQALRSYYRNLENEKSTLERNWNSQFLTFM